MTSCSVLYDGHRARPRVCICRIDFPFHSGEHPLADDLGLAVTIIHFNSLGDGLRERLDPKAASR